MPFWRKRESSPAVDFLSEASGVVRQEENTTLQERAQTRTYVQQYVSTAVVVTGLSASIPALPPEQPRSEVQQLAEQLEQQGVNVTKLLMRAKRQKEQPVQSVKHTTDRDLKF